MKKLILVAVVAIAAATCEAAPKKLPPMPLDENGWRCEGDCDPDAPCRFCNPPPKAKASAKKPRKRSAKSAAKKAAKKPRKRSRKAGEE